MAALFLTAEQVRRNLQLFQGGVPCRANVVPPWSTTIGEAVTRASALKLPQGTAGSSLDTFRDPKFHVDVVSTFLATSMQNLNYIPNGSYEGVVDAEQEAQGFADLLSELQRFGSYMPLVGSQKRDFTYDAADCKALLDDIHSFVNESGIESSTTIVRNLIVQTASLTSTEETTTLFVGYHFQGAESNPSLYIFYGTAKMLRNSTGKSVATKKQSIQVGYFQYQLDSKLVSSMAADLAIITVVSAERVTKSINGRFLLPTE